MQEIDLKALKIISQSQYEKSSNEDFYALLTQSSGGGETVYVVNTLKENKLLGIINYYDYSQQVINNTKVKYNINFKYISNAKYSVENSKIINKYFNLPVLDENKRLLRVHNYLSISNADFYFKEQLTSYFFHHKTNMKNFFIDNGYKKICIIGNAFIFYNMVYEFSKFVDIHVINQKRIDGLYYYVFNKILFDDKKNYKNLRQTIDEFDYDKLANEYDLIIVDDAHYQETAFDVAKRKNNDKFQNGMVITLQYLIRACTLYGYVKKINSFCKQKNASYFCAYLPQYTEDLGVCDEKKLSEFMQRDYENPKVVKFLNETTPEISFQTHHADMRASTLALTYGEPNYTSAQCNFINMARKNTNEPEFFHNHIFLIGQCTVKGVANIDKNTLGSLLQKYINNTCKTKYKVMAYDMVRNPNLESTKYIKKAMLPGDIVIYLKSKYHARYDLGEQKYDFTDFFIKNQNIDIFLDSPVHTNKAGNDYMAKVLADIISKDYDNNSLSNLRKNTNFNKHTNNTKDNQNIQKIQDSQNFKHFIKNIKTNLPKESKTIGSIVMNANPFTNGHLYLAQYASKKVDTLIVFVVEEDKSYFSFEDRFKLVKEGLKDIKNIYVFKSSSFIISKETFPDYFSKETINQITIDTSLDVEIFAKLIAKELGIKFRFVGEEPFDMITKQYNESMQKILPKYDVTFIEIPRAKSSQEVISASKVRKYIKEQNFEKIKQIVPKSTYLYLVKRFKG